MYRIIEIIGLTGIAFEIYNNTTSKLKTVNIQSYKKKIDG